MSTKKWTLNNIPQLKGKKILITGANSGLGFFTTKALAMNGAHIIMACRSLTKGEAARSKIMSEDPSMQIEVMILDLMDMASIRKFAESFIKKFSTLDLLINNAGIMMPPYQKTKNGFESQIGTNHLGHFALTGLLLDLLKKTPQSRVVNVASLAHKNGIMDFNNLLFENGKDYTPMKAYGRSKLANLLFTQRLQELFDENKIDAISVSAHPGVSNTNLAKFLENKFIFKLLKPLFSLLVQSPEKGALPQIRASVDPGVLGGEYYGPSGFGEISGHPVKVESNEASHNKEDAKKLWEFSEELTGVVFEF